MLLQRSRGNIVRFVQLVVFELIILCVSPIWSAERPNVLLILADDLGYGDVHCFNPDSKVATPNLDRLAEQGMRFIDAHSPSTVCTPTRYSIMTGHMAFRLNYRGVFTGVGGPCLIEQDRLTLPELMKEQGYETAMFGKWHIGLTFVDEAGEPIHKNGLDAVHRADFSQPIPDAPVHRGFDHFFGTACCPTTDWLYAYVEGDRIKNSPTKLLDKSKLPKHKWSFDCRRGLIADDFDMEEADMIFLEKSLAFLDDHASSNPDQPFFLFHSTQAVHLPSFPGEQFKGKTEAGPHGDFIFEFDFIVGQLLAKLNSLGMTENTLVIVTSDNGPEVGTVLNMRDDFDHDGASPWRGLKRDNWEGGHRVPLLVSWPGVIEPGRVSSQTVCLTDIMATCAELTDFHLPNDAAEDSFSFLPTLREEQSESSRKFTIHQTINLSLAIRQGDWKYLDHQGSGGNNYASPNLRALALPELAPEAPGQLYDLKDDPGETRNLYNEHPEIVKRLRELLEEAKSTGRSVPRRSE